MGFSGVAYAQGPEWDHGVRKAGKVVEVDAGGSSFRLETFSGDTLQVLASDQTRFRSPDGVVQSVEDLELDMNALVVGEFDEGGILLADLIAVRPPGERPERARMFGEVVRVDLGAQTFELEPREGDPATFHVDERTHFRSHDGSIQGLGDLEAGVKAMVVAVEGEDGGLLARMVAAADPEDIPDELLRRRGEITEVLPDRGTFTLETREGETLTLQAGERTRFEGRGSEVDDLEDLTPGMMAAVGVLEGEDGGFEARFVLVWEQGEFFDRPGVDLRAAGRIVELGGHSFTLERRSGEQLEVGVDDGTTYRSRGGAVEGFEDLEVGMPLVVGAVEGGDGGYLARWVAVGKPAGDEGSSADPGVRPDPPLGLPQEAG
jgi:hypothetical protein